MEEIKKYHLYKDDHSKLHFQVNDASDYCKKNEAHCYKPHQHSFYQFIWFKESGQHYVDYEVIEHKANTLFFLDKKQVHNFCRQSSNDGILFHFDEVFLHQHDPEVDSWLQHKLFNGVGDSHMKLSTSEIDLFDDVSGRIQKEMQLQNHNYSKVVYHYFQLLILSLERLKVLQTNVLPRMDKDYRLAVSFKKLIQDNIHLFQNVEHYSKKLGVSTKKLSEISKTYLGDTPSNVINGRKILEAKRLLSNTNVSIKELAFQLGFDQPTYFTKYFKKHTGLTPKEFVKAML